jgi:hypothetical protein
MQKNIDECGQRATHLAHGYITSNEKDSDQVRENDGSEEHGHGVEPEEIRRAQGDGAHEVDKKVDPKHSSLAWCAGYDAGFTGGAQLPPRSCRDPLAYERGYVAGKARRAC